MVRYLWIETAMISVLSVGWLISPNSQGLTETVIEKVQRTENLTAVTSKEALAFTCCSDTDELVDYSIDIFKLILKQLEQELHRDIELELIALKPKQNIPDLVN